MRRESVWGVQEKAARTVVGVAQAKDREVDHREVQVGLGQRDGLLLIVLLDRTKGLVESSLF
jgi:hypothetical protein